MIGRILFFSDSDNPKRPLSLRSRGLIFNLNDSPKAVIEDA
jgi:hypothetical protein